MTTDLFPKQVEMRGVTMALTYHFEPGCPRDGVTLTVPLYALNQIDPVRCEWLVPGMLKEKAHLLLKSLPQKLRRHLRPGARVRRRLRGADRRAGGRSCRWSMR